MSTPNYDVDIKITESQKAEREKILKAQAETGFSFGTKITNVASQSFTPVHHQNLLWHTVAGPLMPLATSAIFTILPFSKAEPKKFQYFKLGLEIGVAVALSAVALISHFVGLGAVTTGLASIGGFAVGAAAGAGLGMAILPTLVAKDENVSKKIDQGFSWGALFGTALGGVVGAFIPGLGPVLGAAAGAGLGALMGAGTSVAIQHPGIHKFFASENAQLSAKTGAIVGTAIGMVLGGPIGAVLGAALGTFVGFCGYKIYQSVKTIVQTPTATESKPAKASFAADAGMPTTMGGLVGGIIGFAIGGPLGAAIGVAIGTGVGLAWTVFRRATAETKIGKAIDDFEDKISNAVSNAVSRIKNFFKPTPENVLTNVQEDIVAPSTYASVLKAAAAEKIAQANSKPSIEVPPSIEPQEHAKNFSNLLQTLAAEKIASRNSDAVAPKFSPSVEAEPVFPELKPVEEEQPRENVIAFRAAV